jgi:uncharacterized protein (TIGR02186 family)
MRQAARLGLLGCFVLVGLAPGLRAQPEPIAIDVEPARVRIGLFYDGADVVVSAVTDPAVRTAVLVTGPSEDLVMRTKARAWGLFWAPAGEVTFRNVPSLYLLESTAKLADLAPPRVLEELGLGYAALQRAIDQDGGEDLFEELVRLKESEGLFRVGEAAADQGRSSRSTLRIPARAVARTYAIRLFGFRDGRLVVQGEAAIELTRSRITGFVSSLAREHSLLYGLFAVIAALAAGLLAGFLFGSAKKR